MSAHMASMLCVFSLGLLAISGGRRGGQVATDVGRTLLAKRPLPGAADPRASELEAAGTRRSEVNAARKEAERVDAADEAERIAVAARAKAAADAAARLKAAAGTAEEAAKACTVCGWRAF